MAGKIIWYITMLGCGILFYSIGIYANKRKTPMHFWTGTRVDPSEITDVKRYNRANSVMWKLYSLWYFASAIVEIWSPLAATILVFTSCTLGILLLICHYNLIYKKYKVK